MMRAAMIPQKSQLTSLYKYTAPGAATFALRDKALMFGYKTYQAMVVGAAGGRSGTATGATPDRYGSGGGGGSSKLISGTLVSLPTSVAITVGAAGTTGTTGAASGAGGRGGHSTFGALASGYGGYGGKAASSSVANKGGEGGDPTSAASVGPQGGMAAVQYPSEGAWDDALNVGQGGGGGAGADPLDAPQDGGGGSNGSGYYAPGETVQTTNYGGGGAGANIAPITGGAAEYYGTGWNTGHGNGVVVVKLS